MRKPCKTMLNKTTLSMTSLSKTKKSPEWRSNGETL